MGFNTTVFVLNDRLDEIRRNPEKFVQELLHAIISHDKQEYVLGQTTVMPTAHADVSRLYYTHGNSIIELDHPWTKAREKEVESNIDYYLNAVKVAESKLKDLKKYLKLIKENVRG